MALTSLRASLEAGAAELGIELSERQIEQLLAYLELFARWNKAYNLSAVRDPGEMVKRHLLDSLAVMPHLEGQRLIDVGTGGGLPGMVLAICQPECDYTLLDSNGKKTRFLFHVASQLRLTNVSVENCRVEAHRPQAPYDGVISRAFASLADMTQWCDHLVGPAGRFYAMKGVYPTAEIEEISHSHKLCSNIPLHVPGESGERHLLVLGKH